MNKKKGFGLIELMVSILIASIIVTGLYSLLTSSVVNYGFSNASSGAAKTSRQVGNIFNTLISQAGFIGYKKVMAGATHPSRNSAYREGYGDVNPDWSDGQVIMGSEDGTILKIRFYGSSIGDDLINSGDTATNGYILDCRGIGVPNNVELELEFFVDGNNGLVCRQNILAGPFDAQDANFLIDPTVRRLEVLFGVSVPGNNAINNNNGYYRADGIIAAGGVSWTDVSNVRYALVTSVDTGQRMVSAQNNSLVVFRNDEFVDVNNVGDINYLIANTEQSFVHRVMKGDISILNQYQYENP